MTSSKELFLKNNDLLKWWISICHDPRFDQVVTYSRAEVMELRPTGDQMIGCELMLATLKNLVDSDAPAFDVSDAGIGLEHNLVHNRPPMVDEPQKTTED